MIALKPYLIFKDNCEEAFNFYKTVFNGEILSMDRYKAVPEATRQLYYPNSTDEQILHATLQINAGTVLMGNDSVDTYKKSNGAFTNNFFLLISTDDQAEAYRIFDELSLVGKITMPMAQTFWSSHYGIVIDQFGINWKITVESEQK